MTLFLPPVKLTILTLCLHHWRTCKDLSTCNWHYFCLFLSLFFGTFWCPFFFTLSQADLTHFFFLGIQFLHTSCVLHEKVHHQYLPKDYPNSYHVEKGLCLFHILQWAIMESTMTQILIICRKSGLSFSSKPGFLVSQIWYSNTECMYK